MNPARRTLHGTIRRARTVRRSWTGVVADAIEARLTFRQLERLDAGETEKLIVIQGSRIPPLITTAERW